MHELPCVMADASGVEAFWKRLRIWHISAAFFT